MDINLLNAASGIGYIFLWIGLTILFLYLVFFFISLACVIDFNNKLKKRTAALMMIFSLFRDTFLALRDVLFEKKVSLSPAIQELFYKVDNFSFKVKNQDQIIAMWETISELSKSLSFLMEQEKILRNCKDLPAIKDALKDLTFSYHRATALYNVDLAGYEYWRSIIFYRPIFFIFGFRKKKRLA